MNHDTKLVIFEPALRKSSSPNHYLTQPEGLVASNLME